MNWILKRIGQSIFTALMAITVSFFLIRFLPGGPMDFLKAQLRRRLGGVGSGGQAEQRLNSMMEVYANIRPDDPIYIQYLDYVLAVLQGDLGKSFYYGEPVTDILVSALPWTLLVMVSGLFLTFVLGVSFGAMMAFFEGSKVDLFSTALFISVNSIPYFIAGLLLIYVFGYRLGWFPTNGRVAPGLTPQQPLAYIQSVIYHATLPILSIAITGVGGWAISMRGNSISVLGETYMRVGHLRGLPDRRLILEYVGRNAILPMYTSLMISIGFVFGGSVILERIFVYPGVGYYMVEALNTRDYILLMGGFLVITLAVVVGIFIADLTYGFIDPRIQTGDR